MFYVFLLGTVNSINNNCAFRSSVECGELNNITPSYVCRMKSGRCVLYQKKSDKLEYPELLQFSHKHSQEVGKIQREKFQKSSMQRRQQEFSYSYIDERNYEQQFYRSKSSFTQSWGDKSASSEENEIIVENCSNFHR